MSNITTITNPLMQPIQYEGQTYFTSHYFHQQYRNNSGPDGGKYAELKSFNRLVRSIETYQNYVDRRAIVEVTSKSDIPTEAQDLHLAYKSNNYANLMLINVTAQVALTHHLDDEVSKQMSVTANERTAKELPAADGYPQVAKNFRARLQMAKMCGLQGTKAVIAASNWTAQEDGVNPVQSLGIKSLKSDIQSSEMTATQIGEAAGVPGNGQGKAINVNLGLWYLELLESVDSKNGPIWRITEKGLKSQHLEYDDVDKVNGKRGTVQGIVYHETLIPVMKKLELSADDYKELKKTRKEQHMKESIQ